VPVYLLFVYNNLSWIEAVTNNKENSSVSFIDPKSRYFVVEYASSTDSNNAIARFGGAVPYETLGDTQPATMAAAYSTLLQARRF
jgi:hypothetical protein